MPLESRNYNFLAKPPCLRNMELEVRKYVLQNSACGTQINGAEVSSVLRQVPLCNIIRPCANFISNKHDQLENLTFACTAP